MTYGMPKAELFVVALCKLDVTIIGIAGSGVAS